MTVEAAVPDQWRVNALHSLLRRQPTEPAAPPLLSVDKTDRFSLLLLEDGEYYFKDYACHYHPTTTGHRVAGHLKLCSLSLYFVPRNVMEPIFRIPFSATLRMDSVEDNGVPATAGAHDETLRVAATERIDMRMGNRNMPYVSHRGNFKFVFSVMLSTNFQVLEKALVLFEIARGPVEQKAGRIAAIVKEHEASISFNPTWLEGNEKVVMEALASRVTPLVSHPGRIVVTSRCVYFQPFNVVSSAPVLRFPLKAVVNVMRRVRGLEPTGLELFFSEADATDSLYVTFKSEAIRNKFYEMVLQQPHLTWTPKTPNRMLREWQSGRLSNYQYLMWLNMQSDRSFNDLTQYPVFPWVLTDFTSETLNLKDKNVFRDLSKPVGALNPKRLAACRQRYFDMEEANEELEDDNPMKTPPFLYGCHYSTPGFVVYYLLRKAPQLMLRLQNGRFDMADRLMSSVADTFHSVYTNATDLKELTPEFYTLPATFMVNSERLDFGTKQDGSPVDDVELPPWARDPIDFIHKMREALESEYVSRNLHKWIDLIFGYKQRGAAALAADNVFHHLTYDDLGRKQLEAAEDPVLKEAVKVQMNEFGRTPSQLFRHPHPARVAVGSQHSLSAWIPSCYSFGKRDINPSGSWSALQRALRRVVYVPDVSERLAAVAWLEAEATACPEPEVLALRDYGDLLPVVQMCRSSSMEVQLLAARVMNALAACSANCRLIVNAGALEPVVDVLCGTSEQATEVATFLLVRLVEVDSPLLLDFNMSALSMLLELLLRSVEAVRVASATALMHLTTSELNRTNVLRLKGLKTVVKLLQSDHTVATRTLAAQICLNLCVDDDTKLALLELGGVQQLIEMCEQVHQLQLVAVQCLAVLSTDDRLKLEIAVSGGMRLLSAASCSADLELQQAAADAVANMCTDTAIIHVVVQEEGLWSLMAMAQSSHESVQRHAARALWHLAMAPPSAGITSNQVMDMGGLPTLVRLSTLSTSNPQATLLAEEALAKLSEDPAVKLLVEKESERQGKPDAEPLRKPLPEVDGSDSISIGSRAM